MQTRQTFTIDGQTVTLTKSTKSRFDACLFTGRHPHGGIVLLESDAPDVHLHITPAQLASLK